MTKNFSAFLVLATLATTLSACTKTEVVLSQPRTPSVQGPAIDAGSIAQGSSQVVTLSNGAEILVHNIGGKLFYQAEGTFSDDDFALIHSANATKPAAERAEILKQEVGKVFKSVANAKGLALSSQPEVGYFTFLAPYGRDLMGALKAVKWDRSVLLNPVIYDRNSLRNSKAQTASAEGLELKAGARDTTERFSGLSRINAIAFAKQAEADIGNGASVDGSSVNLGITDTGITFNHPTFKNATGATRITYLKDFTREGRIYFNPAAKFAVQAPTGADIATTEDLIVTAEVIATPKLPALPAADDLAAISGLDIKVSPELRAILTQPGNGAKLGVLLEDTLQSDEDTDDINHNGKTNDKLFAILIPGATPEQDTLYFDQTGTGDFRDAKPLHNWNTTHEMMSIFAEKVGFDIKADKLPNAAGTGTVDVRSASIVGYDPGNHGSHVAGIAAGRKTIANDSSDTLAHGVAPEAKILLNRVCSNNAGCGATDGLIDLALNGKAEVINMSLGGLSPFNDGYGVQETMINRLIALKNVMFMISAGNSGPGLQTVGSPSTARLALSIGATATQGMIERQYEWPGTGNSVDATNPDADFMLFFSSRGPTAAGGFKPNLTAPGTELSSVQLNTAPGSRGGLDVYWGTSMAAPTATGAYALLLDGIKKYNAAHPDKALASDSLTLRRVLMESARPFDVRSLDLSTGAKTDGQYTWIDQGTGMIDLLAAWKKLQELRDNAVPSAVSLNGAPVELDYQVLTNLKAPNGITYDGSRTFQTSQGGATAPEFGQGIYLDYAGTEQLKAAYITRNLPASLATSADAGDLTVQLLDSRDEFVLKTVIYGSDKVWLKAGTRDQLNCWESPTANLTVLGRGSDVQIQDDGSGAIAPFNASVLNICINRDMIANELPQGDNGALISAYRVVDGKVAAVPSFIVPVYLTVPHKTLAGSTAYETEQTVASFGVSRNYVKVPEGTSLVRLTLEVPAIKPGEDCSGVELMADLGTNSTHPFATRTEARVSNCDAAGRPAPAKNRSITYTSSNPTAGTWDLHVFGQYKFAKSRFKLRVDYVTADASIDGIVGQLSALTGSFDWTIKESSMALQPSADKSSIELTGFFASTDSKVDPKDHVMVEGPLGKLRAYPAGTTEVTITTGESKGNDIDLTVLECPAGTTDPESSACATAGQSGGPTDEEKVTFKPKAGMLYVARVDGYDVTQNDGKFTSTETITLGSEKGTLTISGAAPAFTVNYTFTAAQLAASKLLNSDLVTSGKFGIVGSLTLRNSDGTTLQSLPVSVTK